MYERDTAVTGAIISTLALQARKTHPHIPLSCHKIFRLYEIEGESWYATGKRLLNWWNNRGIGGYEGDASIRQSRHLGI